MSKPVCSIVVATLCVVVLTTALAQQNVPWTEWSSKQAEKILTDSPWAHRQVETNLTEMFYSPTAQGRGAPNASTRASEGATNQAINITYNIRFFTARPIRRAFVRMYELSEKPDPDSVKSMRRYAEIVSTKDTIIAVTFNCPDQRFAGKVMQAFNSAVTATLKNSTYLERRDGKRVFLEEYVPPGRDGFGARFIFPRHVDGKPFLNEESGEVRFYSEYKDSLKLNMRFKISDMLMDGKLEY